MAKSLKKQTRKAKYEADVERALQLGTSASEFIEQGAMSAVEQIVGAFVDRVLTNIDNQKDFVNSGKISDITVDTKGSTVNVHAHPHLLFQDRGVNGSISRKWDTPHSFKDKMPPVDAIKEWIKTKKGFLTKLNDYHRQYDPRLTRKEKKKDRPFKDVDTQKQIDSAAYAIAKSIQQQGIPPRKIYSKEIPQLMDELGEQLGDFMIQQINQVIDVHPREGGENRTIIIR
jgi:hypothetical protein